MCQRSLLTGQRACPAESIGVGLAHRIAAEEQRNFLKAGLVAVGGQVWTGGRVADGESQVGAVINNGFDQASMRRLQRKPEPIKRHYRHDTHKKHQLPNNVSRARPADLMQNGLSSA